MHKELHFITGNNSKYEEAKLLLKETSITLIKQDLKTEELKSLDQEKVVIDKANKAFEILKKPVLTDDTGIYFDEYKDFPGTYTKSLFKAIGFRGVERLLSGTKRTAYFKTIVCYKDEHTTKTFSGIFKGRIVDEVSKKFNPDWEYNSIFIPDDFDVPLSEIPLVERAKVSHRSAALKELVKFLREKDE